MSSKRAATRSDDDGPRLGAADFDRRDAGGRSEGEGLGGGRIVEGALLELDLDASAERFFFGLNQLDTSKNRLILA